MSYGKLNESASFRILVKCDAHCKQGHLRKIGESGLKIEIMIDKLSDSWNVLEHIYRLNNIVVHHMIR